MAVSPGLQQLEAAYNDPNPLLARQLVEAVSRQFFILRGADAKAAADLCRS